MSDLPSCTAGMLATREVATIDASADVTTTAQRLEENGYDVAPVVEDDSPLGYVERDQLSASTTDESVKNHIESITLSDIISPDAPFETVLEALYQKPFYFLGGQNEVTGVLTRADLNTTPARNHLFSLVQEVEQALRRLVNEQVPNWAETTPLDPDHLDDIRERHQEARKANIDLSLVHYAYFSMLGTIVSEHQECWEACGYDAAHQASSQLDDITNLRNDVAHATPIVEDTESTDALFEEARTITDLIDTYDEMMNLVDRLTTVH